MQNPMKISQKFDTRATHMGRLEKGADIIRGIEAYCKERNITAAWVNVIGAIDEVTISYYDQMSHKYFHKELKGDYEIVSCSGNVSLKDGEPFAHLHIVLSGMDYATKGGHLWPESASVFAAEFVLFELDPQDRAPLSLHRCADPETGLALW